MDESSIAAGGSAVRPPSVVRRRRLLPALLVGLLAAQAWALYSPGDGLPPPFPHADKLVHLALFGIPTAVAVRVPRWRAGVVAALMIAHAVESEIVQYLWIPLRSGDVVDALADTVGVALGVASLGRRRTGPGRAGAPTLID